jgi:predicted DsbA family dithiol-disulfide isomerase
MPFPHPQAPPVALTGDPDERNYKSDRFALGTLTTITLVHDYLCPWSWIGWHHAVRLTKEFGLTFDWRGGELVPPSMNYTPGPRPPADPNAPPPPKGRFDLFAEAEGIEMPKPGPPFRSTHNALLAAEWAWMERRDDFDALNEAIYRAHWERSEDIANVDVLVSLADAAGLDGGALADSVRSARYDDHILPFDDDIYAFGIRHIPTFFFNAEEKLGEAPYADLANATDRFLVRVERIRTKYGLSGTK